MPVDYRDKILPPSFGELISGRPTAKSNTKPHLHKASWEGAWPVNRQTHAVQLFTHPLTRSRQPGATGRPAVDRLVRADQSPLLYMNLQLARVLVLSISASPFPRVFTNTPHHGIHLQGIDQQCPGFWQQRLRLRRQQTCRRHSCFRPRTHQHGRCSSR